MKILIADDDRTVHVAYSKFLQRAGHEVANAYDGEEAMTLARDFLPDLLLLDVMMPNKDGRDVCKVLKCDPATNNITIVMLTAKDEQWDRTTSLELGADDYVVKPCTTDFMDRLVRDLARKKGL